MPADFGLAALVGDAFAGVLCAALAADAGGFGDACAALFAGVTDLAFGDAAWGVFGGGVDLPAVFGLAAATGVADLAFGDAAFGVFTGVLATIPRADYK